MIGKSFIVDKNLGPFTTRPLSEQDLAKLRQFDKNLLRQPTFMTSYIILVSQECDV